MSVIALANLKLPSIFAAPPETAQAGVAAETNLASPAASGKNPLQWQMCNQFFRVRFELDSGRFSIWRNNEQAIFKNATCAVVGGKGRRLASENNYARSVRISQFSDQHGNGWRMTAQCIDRRHELDVEVRISIYNQCEAFGIETIARNVSKDQFTIRQIDPLCVDESSSGALSSDIRGERRRVEGCQPNETALGLMFALK